MKFCVFCVLFCVEVEAWLEILKVVENKKIFKLKSFSIDKSGDMLIGYGVSEIRPDSWTHYMLSVRGENQKGSENVQKKVLYVI